jgi:predicted dehydrogenase
MRTPVTVGVLGLGRRGLRLASIFDELPQTELRWVCDESAQARAVSQSRYPRALLAADPAELLEDESLDTIVIATPPETHYGFVGSAINANKHVFVDEPLALTGEQAEDLVHRAEYGDRRLMVGHMVLFHRAVRKLKEMNDAGQLGDIYYVAGSRFAPGPPDVLRRALADDLAVLMYLLADQPIEVSARGESYIWPDVPDVVFCFLKFATGITAHIHASRLDLRRDARFTAVASRGTAVLDDTGIDCGLTIYQNAERHPPSDPEERRGPVLGDVVSPRLTGDDPFVVACERFLASVRSPARAPDNAREAAAIVHVLGAVERSADQNGTREPVTGPPAHATVIELPV